MIRLAVLAIFFNSHLEACIANYSYKSPEYFTLLSLFTSF